jgi:asparagine synthase (glutamine-hydrolysing)
MGMESRSWSEYSHNLAAIHQGMRRFDLRIPAYMRPVLSERYLAASGDNLPSDFHREMFSRTGGLMRYNLWHEDRTSSSQGIEARVPFLDHRLVELLAAVPVELHERMFFDKKIVREQLARVAPFYPPDKKKVGFIKTGKGELLNNLNREVVLRVYPAFREKYLLRQDAIFSVEALDTHHEFLRQNSKAGSRDIKEMLNCLAITVFADWCKRMATSPPPRDRHGPSPLQNWSPPGTRPAASQVTLDSWTMEL